MHVRWMPTGRASFAINAQLRACHSFFTRWRGGRRSRPTCFVQRTRERDLIINLRGTSGAGKTTIVRSLIASIDIATPIYGALGARLPEAIQLGCLQRPLFALGPYPAAGCDAVVSRLGVRGVINLLEK